MHDVLTAVSTLLVVSILNTDYKLMNGVPIFSGIVYYVFPVLVTDS